MTTKATRDVLDLNTRPVTNINITGGTIDNTPIGTTTPSSGTFTNLATTGSVNIPVLTGVINYVSNLQGYAKFTYGSGSVELSSVGNGVGVTNTISTLRANTYNLQAYEVLGYNLIGDGGGGSFYFDVTDSTSSDNDGTIIVDAIGNRWKRTNTNGIVNVKWFGATGNGSTDDTTAIQNAITYALTLPLAQPYYEKGIIIYFPSGIYLISSALNIKQQNNVTWGSGFRILGESVASTIIQQNTNNTQIFIVNNSQNVNNFEFAYFTATWTNIQTISNTNANIIAFQSSTGTNYANFEIHNISGGNGYRFISAEGDYPNGADVWGCYIHDCVRSGTMCGAFYSIDNYIGQPRITFKRIYINVGTYQGESIFYMQGCDTLLFEQIEFNGQGSTSFVWGKNFPLIETSECDVIFRNVRSETIRMASNQNSNVQTVVLQVPTFVFCSSQQQQHNVIVENCNFTIANMDNSVPTAFYFNGKNTININGLFSQTYGTTDSIPSIQNGTFFTPYLVLGLGTINCVSGIYWGTTNFQSYGYYTHANNYYSTFVSHNLRPILNLDGQAPNCVNYRLETTGTITTTVTDAKIQNYQLTRTGNITHNLPSIPSLYPNIYVGDGYEQIITVNAATPGPFTLTVSDPLSGQSYTIPANMNGSVHYKFDMFKYAWSIISASTWA